MWSEREHFVHLLSIKFVTINHELFDASLAFCPSICFDILAVILIVIRSSFNENARSVRFWKGLLSSHWKEAKLVSNEERSDENDDR